MAAPIDLNRDQTILGDLANFEGLRSVVNPSQDQVRLHAAAVRRLLLDGVLSAAAGSRKLPLLFKVPDAKPLETAAKNRRLIIYTLGGMEAFGIFTRHGALWAGSAAPDVGGIGDVDLKLESFLKQKVAFVGMPELPADPLTGLHGVLLSRHDVLLYVANKVGGVHYDPKPTAVLPEMKMKAFGRLRRAVKMGTQDGMAVSHMKIPNPEEEQSEHFRYEPEFIDAVYLEFLAMIQFIIHSSQVKALREAIQADLAKHP